MTAVWPEKPCIRAAITWNETERKRAQADCNDPVKVPNHAHKIVKGEKVPLTADEYREQRANDAERYGRNIKALRERL